MRVTLTSGGRKVDIRIDGDSSELLKEVEGSILRMLAALPKPDLDADPGDTFGFSLSADTERAPEPAPPDWSDE